jgi:membrane fusion protein, copper/silver efflux system
MKPYRWSVLMVVIAALSGAGGYWWGHHQPSSNLVLATTKPVVKPERKVLYWYDPMKPEVHFDKPGQSPYMDMALKPQYAEDTDERDTPSSAMKIDPTVSQNLGMRLATVIKGVLPGGVEASGTLTFNERDSAIVQARTNGFVERVYARAPGDVIVQGAPLADVLVPEWSAAQIEFLALLGSGEHGLIDAARSRLRLLGMSPDLIARVEKTRTPRSSITISSPISGVIQSIEVRTGMTLLAGQTLAKINGFRTVWLDVAVPEAQSDHVAVGAQGHIRFNAFPGQHFTGKVIAILPDTNVESRTLKVRIELPNTRGHLRPGLFAQVRFAASSSHPALLVPSEAIIRTGQRSLIMLAEEKGSYQAVEVETGQESNGQTVILRGVEEGQKVVASGQFLIDSEANLKGMVIRKLETMKAAKGKHNHD